MTDLGALAGADVRIDGRFEADGSGAAARAASVSIASPRPTASRRGSTCRRTGRSAANSGSKASSPPARSMPAARAHCGLPPISRRRSISISSRDSIGGNKVQGRLGAALRRCAAIDGSIEADIARRAGRDRGRDRHAGATRRGRSRLVAPSRSPGARPG